MVDVKTLREWLDHSPPASHVPLGASRLAGFMADGVEICSECSGRLLARGFRLGDKVESIWDRVVVCEVHVKDGA